MDIKKTKNFLSEDNEYDSITKRGQDHASGHIGSQFAVADHIATADENFRRPEHLDDTVVLAINFIFAVVVNDVLKNRQIIGRDFLSQVENISSYLMTIAKNISDDGDYHTNDINDDGYIDNIGVCGSGSGVGDGCGKGRNDDLKKGDVVAFFTTSSIETIVFYVACLKVGLVTAVTNIQHTIPELSEQLQICAADAIFTDLENVEVATKAASSCSTIKAHHLKV
ncbi:hypothetical protein HELRODRAFT_169566 [Helobdella robusta]|uniref:AMP-dependent synthetase/ligase domain-containing protein n=1 Tax=Helobdella robusta TaxID=6412 RepID=T1F239_HELRO|nr:hypothetical protein HELRODRAFT_169566 [Helobdella robusta]ESO07870.1 hypothetical protein HELRODRAFT_169566 [Helobdella robusta]